MTAVFILLRKYWLYVLILAVIGYGVYSYTGGDFDKVTPDTILKQAGSIVGVSERVEIPCSTVSECEALLSGYTPSQIQQLDVQCAETCTMRGSTEVGSE